MPGIDRDIVLEALSALTKSNVKPLVDDSDSISATELLTIKNVLNAILFKPKIKRSDISKLVKVLNDLSVRDEEEEEEEEEESESESDECESNSGISTLRNELFVDMKNFFHPKYDYDFRSFTDDSELKRGGESYKRPCGWYRFALKVRDKYPDGNKWLGSKGWRSHSDAGEWPVSFHGTSIEAAKGIVSSNYQAGAGMAYGRGIYSTPDIKAADYYAMAETFTSKKNGKTYKVIMQNRINPQKRKITDNPNCWLIPVPDGSTVDQEKKIVESSIRPYGILIKEVVT